MKANVQYGALRKKIGSRRLVSLLLGVHRKTIYRREIGRVRVTDEMMMAMRELERTTKI